MKNLKSLLFAIFLTVVVLGGMLPPVIPVMAEGTTEVIVQPPGVIDPDSDFIAKVNINNVQDFHAADYRIVFNPKVLRLDNVTAGTINGTANGTAVPVDMWANLMSPNASGNTVPGVYTIINKLPTTGTPPVPVGASGSGFLADLHFHVIGNPAGAQIYISNGTLSNLQAQPIAATWAPAPLVDHFEFTNIGNQTGGVAFGIQVTAKDKDNNTVSNYNQEALLYSKTGSVIPDIIVPFENGVWNGNVTLGPVSLSVPSTPSAADRAGEGFLLADTNYKFSVAATNNGGATVASTVGNITTANDSDNHHRIRLTLTRVTDAKRYNIFCSTDADPKYQGSIADPGSGTTFTYDVDVVGSGETSTANRLNAVGSGGCGVSNPFTVAAGAPPTEYDFGDAPSPYPTMDADTGAKHVIDALFLGTAIDAEADGQPTADADGDDTNGTPNDEDGVFFPGVLNAGQQNSVIVTASAPGKLQGWIDFNADNDWEDAGEQIFTNVALTTGQNNLNFNIPAQATWGLTYARFRVSSQTGLSFTGAAQDGEVEDYKIVIEAAPPAEYDFGDAPSPYPTMDADTGAKHVIGALFLGTAIDAEADGQPTADADGDDTNGTPNDEDGVVFTGALMAGQQRAITVTASAPGKLQGWIDFNADNDWEDAGEQIFTNQALTMGTNNLNFNIPAEATVGATYARFRLSTQTDLSFCGEAGDGEVEDYKVMIAAAPPTAVASFEIKSDSDGDIGNQVAGSPFNIKITAKSESGQTVTTYNGTNTLGDTTGTIKPKTTAAFENGVWTGLVGIRKPATGVTITTQGGTASGESNAFNVAGIRIENTEQKRVFALATGGSLQTTFNISSIADFGGPVTLAFRGPPELQNNTTVNPTNFELTPGGQQSATLNLGTVAALLPGTYLCSLEGASGDTRANYFMIVNIGVTGQPWLALAPNYGQAGDRVNVIGANFNTSLSGQTVTIRDKYTNITIPTQPSPLTMSAGGFFLGEVAIPSGWLEGIYRLQASVGTGVNAQFAEAEFQVVGGGTTFSMYASPQSTSVTTDAGMNSTTVSIILDSIAGASPSVSLSIENKPWWLTYKFGSLNDNTPASGANAIAVPAGGSASVELGLTVDMNTPMNPYYITVKGEGSGAQYIDIELFVMPGGGIAMAGISLNPNKGPAGTPVTVSGWGFTPNDQLSTLTFSGFDILGGATINTSNTGGFSTTFTVPPQMWGVDITGGQYWVDAYDSQWQGGGAWFEVTESGQKFTVSVDPTWILPIAPGSNGTTTVTVESLGEAVTVALSAENLPFGVAYRFSSGTTTETLTVPLGGKKTTVLTLTPGNNVPGGTSYGGDVKAATSGAGAEVHYAHFEFGVKSAAGFGFPEITLNPNMGNVGDTITIFGMDFAENDTLTKLTFNGDEQDIPDPEGADAKKADSTGSFTIYLTVPEVDGGSYQVGVECGGHYIEKPFQVFASGATFTMWSDPQWLGIVNLGESMDTTIYVQSLGAQATVNLGLSVIPPGMTAKFLDSSGNPTLNTTSVTAPAGATGSATLRVNPTTCPTVWYSIQVTGKTATAEAWTYVDFQVGSSGTMNNDWMASQGIYYPGIVLNPDRGVPGDQITVQGTGFPAVGTVKQFKLGEHTLPLPTGANEKKTDSSGNVTLAFKVPTGAPEGWPTVSVMVEKDLNNNTTIEDAEKFWAYASFWVIPAGMGFGLWAEPGYLGIIQKGTTADTQIKIDNWGGAITVALSLGFVTPGVTAKFLDASGNPTLATKNVPVATGSMGSSGLRIDPAKMLPGPGTVEVRGKSGETEISTWVNFDFGSGSIMDNSWMANMGIYYPSIILNPDKGVGGDQITVQGSGFPAVGTVKQFKLGGNPLPLPTETAQLKKTDESGNVTLMFKVPAGAPEGWPMVDVMVEQDLNNNGQIAPEEQFWASASFWVVPSGMGFGLWADPGYLGILEKGTTADTRIKIDNFGGALTVALSLGFVTPGVIANFLNAAGSPAGNTASVNVATGGQGGATLRIDPAKMLPGPGTVEIRGKSGETEMSTWVNFDFGTSNVMDNTWMANLGIYYPNIKLNPDKGVGGDQITVQGSGFPALGTVKQFKLGGNPLPLPTETAQLKKTDESGNVTLMFKVPANAPEGWPMVDVMVEQDLNNNGQIAPEEQFWASASFWVVPSGMGFGLWADPGYLGIVQKGTTADTRIKIDNFGGAITVALSLGFVTPGVTANFLNAAGSPAGNTASVNVATGGQGGATLRIDPAKMLPGPGTVEIRGKSGDTEMSVYVNFDFGTANIMDTAWMTNLGIYYPSIKLNPDRGVAGDQITVQGSGFPAQGTVKLFNFAGSPLPLPTETAQLKKTDESGNVTLMFKVPANAPEGWPMVDVMVEKDLNNNQTIEPHEQFWAYASFWVVPAGMGFGLWSDPGYMGIIEKGNYADTQIKIDNWGSALTVALSLDYVPDGVTAKFLDAAGSPTLTTTNVTVAAGGQGGATLRITPTAIPPGPYSVAVKGKSGDTEMFTYVNFDFGSANIMNALWMSNTGNYFPEMKLTPDNGKVGTKVTIYGSGFPAGAKVDTLFVAYTQQELPTGDNAITADSDGNFTLVTSIPTKFQDGSSIPPGSYPFDLSASKTNVLPIFITKYFEVTSTEESLFSLSVTPEYVPGVEMGGTAKTKVTVASTATEQISVQLGVEGLPWDTTATFTPIGATAPSNTLTIPAGGKKSATLLITTTATTPPGSFGLTITGVRTGEATDMKTVNFGLEVVMPASFGIAMLKLDPDFVPAGYGNKQQKINFTGTGFPPEEETLVYFAGTLVDLPTGFKSDSTGTFNGAFKLPTGLLPGNYMVEAWSKVTGKGDAKQFTIKAADSTFMVELSPSFLPPLEQGASGTATINVKSVAKTGTTVTLSIDGLAGTGASATFDPANAQVKVPAGKSGSAKVTISVGAGAMPGNTYPLTIVGKSGDEVVMVPFGFSVMTKVPEGEKSPSISVNPSSGIPGSNITISGAGFTKDANVALKAAAEGSPTVKTITPSGTVKVQANGTWSCQITVPPASELPAGIYVITATDGTVSAKTKFEILPPSTTAALTIDLSPSFLQITQDSSGNVTLRASSKNAFDKKLKFGVGGLAPGVTVKFTNAKNENIGEYQGTASGTIKVLQAAVEVQPVPGESLTINVRVTAAADAALGPFTVPIEVSYNPTIVTNLNLMIIPTGTNLIISPNKGTVDTDVSLSGSGFDNGENINITIGGSTPTKIVPAAVKASSSGTFTAVITVPKLNAGVYPVKAVGATSGKSAEAPFKLNPAETSTFTLSAKPGQNNIPRGGSGTYSINIEPAGSFNSTVNLALSGLTITGAQSAFSPASVTPKIGTSASSILTISNIPNDADMSQYTLTVTGTSDTNNDSTVDITQKLDLGLKIIPSAANKDFNISAAPESVTIKQGSSGTTTVSIVALNGFNAAVQLSLTMADDSPLPAGITHNATQITPSASGKGTQTVTFNVAADVAEGSKAIKITGTSGTTVHSTQVTLVVTGDVTSQCVTSPLVDPSTVTRVTPITLTTSGNDIVQINSVIPSVQESLSATACEVATTPASIGSFSTIPNWDAARSYVTNMSTSKSLAGINWQFTMGYNPSTLTSSNLNPSNLSLAYLDSSDGQWKLKQTGVTLRLVPSASSVSDGVSFTMDIQVEAGTQQVAAVDAFIDFNPSVLEVTSIAPNTDKLGTVATNTHDDTNGTITYSALKGLIQEYPISTFTIATITFRGKASSPTLVPVSFVRSGARITDVAYGTGSVLGAMYDTDNQVTFTNVNSFSTWTLVAAKAAPSVVVRLVPSASSVIVNSNFTVAIQVEAGEQPIANVDAFINFNPAQMQLINIVANTSKLGTVAVNNGDSPSEITAANANGNANYCAGKSAQQEEYPTGTFTIATITFKCKAESEDAALTFFGAIPRKTDVSYGEGSIHPALVECTIDQVYDVPLRLMPASQSAGKDQNFNMTLEVNASGSQQVSLAEAYINFLPEYLEVVSVTPITTSLDTVDESKAPYFNNTNGTIDFKISKSASYPTGNFGIATITFKALKVVTTPGTPVTFSISGDRKSTLKKDTTTVYGAHANAAVIVNPVGKITGEAKLQGTDRPTTPSGYNVPLTLKLYDSSVELNVYNIALQPGQSVEVEGVTYNYIAPLFTYTTADNQLTFLEPDYINKKVKFETPTITPGTYDVTLTTPGCLINLMPSLVISESGATSLDMKTLIEGNPNGDEQIAIGDYTLLLGDYLATPADTNRWHDGRCDLDRDTQVRGVDFAILSMNYGQYSPIDVH